MMMDVCSDSWSRFDPDRIHPIGSAQTGDRSVPGSFRRTSRTIPAVGTRGHGSQPWQNGIHVRTDAEHGSALANFQARLNNF
jgi:hypothetical protein